VAISQAIIYFRQAAIMKTQTQISNDQLSEMKSSGRAWVGPVTAAIEGNTIKLNELTKVIVSYHNTGREPGLDLFSDLFVDSISIEEDQSGIAAQKIASYVTRCRATESPRDSGVAFPTSGFSTYNLTTTIDGSLIDYDILYGVKMIIVTGCLVYKTLDTVHRSSFCFFFQNGRTPANAWAFCRNGNHAD
jgi:hypothetical protein